MENYDIDGVAMECWSLLPQRYGISGCQIIGQLCQKGIPTACEGDILGAVTAVMMQAATLDREPIFFRHYEPAPGMGQRGVAMALRAVSARFGASGYAAQEHLPRQGRFSIEKRADYHCPV